MWVWLFPWEKRVCPCSYLLSVASYNFQTLCTSGNNICHTQNFLRSSEPAFWPQSHPMSDTQRERKRERERERVTEINGLRTSVKQIIGYVCVCVCWWVGEFGGDYWHWSVCVWIFCLCAYTHTHIKSDSGCLQLFQVKFGVCWSSSHLSTH